MFVVDVKNRFKVGVKLLKTRDKLCNECVSKVQNICQYTNVVVENTKQSQLEKEILITESAGIKGDLEKLLKYSISPFQKQTILDKC